MLPGVLMYDQGIELNEEIVIVTTKGEAVAIGKYIFKVTVMFSSTLFNFSYYSSKTVQLNVHFIIFIFNLQNTYLHLWSSNNTYFCLVYISYSFDVFSNYGCL